MISMNLKLKRQSFAMFESCARHKMSMFEEICLLSLMLLNEFNIVHQIFARMLSL